MKRIFYAGGSVVTGDEIADAVVRLTCALARHGQVEVADIPIVDATGETGRAQLVLGRGSQVMCVSSASYAELVDESAVAALIHQAGGGSQVSGAPLDESEQLIIDDLEW
jgi:hypothetical protein